jgi:hypothetical protein
MLFTFNKGEIINKESAVFYVNLKKLTTEEN